MDKQELKQFLVATEEAGIAALYNRGFAWLKSEFLPKLQLAESLLPEETILQADCWYLLGDVYDFNEAPEQAITAYQTALLFDDTIEGPYREIAHMHELIGEYPTALDYINRALELQPDDTLLMEDKSAIQDSINYTTEPHFTEDNLIWQDNEDLAAGQVERVIRRIETLEAPTAVDWQSLARAYGAKGDLASYQKAWDKLLKAAETLDWSYADLFYMPQQHLETARTWEQFKQLIPRIDVYAFMSFDSLEEVYGDQLTAEEHLVLIADYYHHKANHNTTALKALAKAYPKWEEVQA